MSNRILLLSSRADHGGGPRHIEYIINETYQNFEFHVACPEEAPYWSRFQKLVGNRMVRLPHRQLSLGSLRSVLRYVSYNSIDLIHSHGKGAGLYAKIIKSFTRKRWLHTPHGIHVDQYRFLTKKFYSFYENFLLSNPDKIIFVSEEERKKANLEKIWVGVPFDVVPNGVSIISMENRKALRSKGRELIGLSDKDKVVVTLSRFDYQKNMREAFLIAQRLPNMKFIWVGDGPEKVKLNEEIKNIKIKNIKIIDFCDNSLPYLGAGDIYLSTSKWEGLPLSILEAMSLGLPIVASNVIGHKDLVEKSQSGILYTLGNQSEAVKAIKRLLEDKTLYNFTQTSAINNQTLYFSSKLMGEKISKIYSKILNPRTSE